MHPKILHKARIADMLRDEKRSEFWNESARYQRFPSPTTSPEVSVDVCREVRLLTLQKKDPPKNKGGRPKGVKNNAGHGWGGKRVGAGRKKGEAPVVKKNSPAVKNNAGHGWGGKRVGAGRKKGEAPVVEKNSPVVKSKKPRKKGSGSYKKRDYPWMTDQTKIEFTFKKNKTTATYAGNNKWTWDFGGNPQTDSISRFAGDWIRHLVSTQKIAKGGTSKNGWDVCNQPGHARGDWENYGNC